MEPRHGCMRCTLIDNTTLSVQHPMMSGHVYARAAAVAHATCLVVNI